MIGNDSLEASFDGLLEIRKIENLHNCCDIKQTKMKIILRQAVKQLLKQKPNKLYHDQLLKNHWLNVNTPKALSTKCENISSMSKLDSEKFLTSFDTILTDRDGVLWVGGKAIEGSPEAIMRLRKLGKRIIFVTNNGMSRNDLLLRCQQLGFGGEIDDMITSSYLCASYLKQLEFTKTVYVFGGKGLKEELDNAGIENIGEGSDEMPNEWNLETAEDTVKRMDENVGCVIVGFHYDLSFMKLLKAVTYLQNPNVIFLATNSDPMAVIHFQQKTCIMPATGAFISAVETASGRKASILGKPERFMFDSVKNVFSNIIPERTLMVGDRADTDVLFGKNSGVKTLMVGTGTNTINDINQWEMSDIDELKELIPHFYSETLYNVVEHENY